MKHTNIIPETHRFRNTFVRFRKNGKWTSPRRLVEPVVGIISDDELLIRPTPKQDVVVAHIVQDDDVPDYIRAVCPPVLTETEKRDAFKEARARRGLTQKEAAELIGVTVKAVEHWEQGRRAVPQYAINAVSR
jgi:DNA-binding transcriptional regulator YiaG